MPFTVALDRIVLSVVVLLFQYSSGQAHTESDNSISGIWSDACPCHIPCSCWRTQRASAPNCVNFQVFRIEHGTVHGANLTGSIFVLLNMSDSLYTSPSEKALLIDASAGEKRAAAIREFARDLGFNPPEVLRVSLKLEVSAKRQTLEISNMLKYTITLPEHSVLATEVADYLYPWLHDPSQGVTERVRYVPPSE